MAVKNSLVQAQKEKIAEFDSGNGQMVKLSPNIVRNYLVQGGGDITDQEIVMYINLCKFNGLNPFLKETYCVKYGAQPAQMLVSKEAYLKRAFRNPKYQGFLAGVIVLKEDGTTEKREGCFYLPNETVVGGWAEVYVDGIKNPYSASVPVHEYVQTKKDGTANTMWSTKTGTMIRKVAIVQAMREAFPDTLSGLQLAEEQGMIEETVCAEATHIENPNIENAEAEISDIIEDQIPGQTEMEW